MKPFTIALILCMAPGIGCDSGASDDEETGARSLHLRLRNIEPLPADYHFEGWILGVDGELRSMGKFNVDASGTLVDRSGNQVPGSNFVTDFDLDEAVSVSITIEPPGDVDEAPSGTRLLGGTFIGQRAELHATHVDGIQDNLLLAAGTFIVASPTDGPDTNENSGIWFINLTGGPPARGLRVPIPIEGWSYQGWVDMDGVTVATGEITHASESDAAAPHSGPMPGFDYPGEDFLFNAPAGLTFPISVDGAIVVVTLEPSPDPDPGRSSLELLRGSVPSNPVAGATYFLERYLSEFPDGDIRISD